MIYKRLLVTLPILSFVWLAATTIIAGYFYPDYSHISQFISELGATGSPHGPYVNYLGFIPTELFILGFVYCCFKVMPKTKSNLTGLILITIYALSLGLTALFPCDFQCEADEPTLSHNIHIIVSLPGYFCAILAMFVIASGATPLTKTTSFKATGMTIGIFATLALVNLNPELSQAGLYQRILESLIYGWLIYFGASLSRTLDNKH
ncbi:DUF998 domain-containing protein [Kangiella shandongensis]|uniref:DUF998 domain-containing protein n=1 Tax=Kangiella shandongensis TaxID=2763258 RepID=UPI001CBB2A70|nr:DUF998 domain-containing protein [Kangiella shandongensis]